MIQGRIRGFFCLWVIVLGGRGSDSFSSSFASNAAGGSSSVDLSNSTTKDGLPLSAVAEWLGMNEQDASQYAGYWQNMEITDIQSEHVGQSAFDNLTSEQQNAMNKWTTIKSHDIRKSQQDGKPSADAEALESLISDSPKWFGGETYRGLNSVDSKTLKALTTKGASIDMRGLSSWSTSKDVASDFAYSKSSPGIVFVAKAQPQGTSVRGYSSHPHENEVLVSSKAKYTVENATYDSNENVWYVRLKND